jgi:hypothetical protein
MLPLGHAQADQQPSAAGQPGHSERRRRQQVEQAALRAQYSKAVAIKTDERCNLQEERRLLARIWTRRMQNMQHVDTQ